jgi:hypothetical protein
MTDGLLKFKQPLLDNIHDEKQYASLVLILQTFLALLALVSRTEHALSNRKWRYNVPIIKLETLSKRAVRGFCAIPLHALLFLS